MVRSNCIALAASALLVFPESVQADDFYQVEVNFRCEYELNGLPTWKYYQLNHNPNQTLLYTTERSNVTPKDAGLVYGTDVGDDLFPGAISRPIKDFSFIKPFGRAEYMKSKFEETPKVPPTLRAGMLYGPLDGISKSGQTWEIKSAIAVVDTFDLNSKQFIRHSFLFQDTTLELDPSRISLSELSRGAVKSVTHRGDCIEMGAQVQLGPDGEKNPRDFGSDVASAVVEGIVAGAVEGLIGNLFSEE